MKDKIYKSFEEWLAEHNELINLHFGGASQMRSAWNARNSEIQELKYKNNDLSNLLLKTESDLLNQVEFTGDKLLEIKELKNRVEELEVVLELFRDNTNLECQQCSDIAKRHLKN